MTLFYNFCHIVSWAVFIYLAANSVYLFILALCGLLISGKSYSAKSEKFTFAILIPCYKEDLIIQDTAKHARHHDFPANRFSVTVIADKLKPETIQLLKEIPVLVMEVDLNMKSRSIHAALESMDVMKADIVMILDADNIMGPGCLDIINSAFHNGLVAVQCHRTAKNKNTSVALLDAISEEININLFRRGPSVAGLSAAPIGSGMAFRTDLIREIFSTNEILSNPGEDREIDMQLMRRKIKMEFLDNALVFDEKVTSAGIFEKQRVRWLEAQVNHVRRFFDQDMKSAPRTFLYYNKFFQNLLLPRVLILVVFCLMFLIILFQKLIQIPFIQPTSVYWIIVMGLYFLTLIISIPRIFYNVQTLIALSHIPLLMFTMVKAVFQMKKKRNEFIHTPKSFTADK